MNIDIVYIYTCRICPRVCIQILIVSHRFIHEKDIITIQMVLTIDSLSVIEKCYINMKRNVILGVNISLKYSLAPTAVTSKTNVSDKHK